MSKKIYANSFAERENVLRLHCISHKTLPNKKSDAFLFEYCGEFYLIDGGLASATYVVEYLLELRRELLKDHPELCEDTSCKLRINWIISHFHEDHVNATIHKLIPSPYFEFGDIYSPPDSDIAPEYLLPTKDGDAKLRPRLAQALAALEDPTYRIHDIPFGKEHRFSVSTSSGTGKEVAFTFLPPVRDLGEKWYMDYIGDYYINEAVGIERMPVSAVNNSSLWVLVTFAGRKILFTGDTMKREKHLYSEGLEYMMDAYAEEIGKLDVLKYVHHGYARNHALDAMMSFDPTLLIVSKTDSTIPELVKKRYPDTDTAVMNVADKTLVISCTSDGELSYEWKDEE